MKKKFIFLIILFFIVSETVQCSATPFRHCGQLFNGLSVCALTFNAFGNKKWKGHFHHTLYTCGTIGLCLSEHQTLRNIGTGLAGLNLACMIYSCLPKHIQPRLRDSYRNLNC